MKKILFIFIALLWSIFAHAAFIPGQVLTAAQLNAALANAAITSGTINGATIGATTPSSGVFTTLSSSIPLPVTSGGTGAASYTAPSGTINPIVFWDGTRFNTDVIAIGLGYDAVNDIFYTPTLKISNALTTTATFTNTGAQGPLGGSGMVGYSDPGAAILSGSRLGFYLAGGSIDAAHTLVNPVGWGGFAAENFSATNQGASFQIYTTPIGSTTASRRLVSTFGADGSQTNIGTISGTQFTSTVATGTAPFVVNSTTPVANLNIGGNAATATTATNLSGGTVSATSGTFSAGLTSTASATNLGTTTTGTLTSQVTGTVAGNDVMLTTYKTGGTGSVIQRLQTASLAASVFDLETNDGSGTAYRFGTNIYDSIISNSYYGTNPWGSLRFATGGLTRMTIGGGTGGAAGLVTFANGLTSTAGQTTLGTTTIGPLLISTGAVANQLRSAQTTPPTCTTNCGTGGTVIGTDTAGKVTIGATGTPASGVLITFNGTWAAAPSCTAVATKAGMTAFVNIAAATTTTLTLTTAAAPANSDTYSYHCIGVQ